MVEHKHSNLPESSGGLVTKGLAAMNERLRLQHLRLQGPLDSGTPQAETKYSDIGPIEDYVVGIDPADPKEIR